MIHWTIERGFRAEPFELGDGRPKLTRAVCSGNRLTTRSELSGTEQTPQLPLASGTAPTSFS
jgi:hypothetical protein